MKKVYIAAIGTMGLISLIAIVLAFFKIYQGSIALISLQIALIPIIAHLRMRRQQKSLRTLIAKSSGGSSSYIFENTKITKKLDSLEKISRHIDRNTSRSYANSGDTQENYAQAIAEYAHEIRQESKMLRQLIDDIKKN